MIRNVKNLYHLFCAFFAALIFRYPASNLKIIGVTGTDGKTTVSHLIYEILKQAGKRVSLVSSIKAEIGGKKYDTGFHVTTPNSWLLQKFLRKAVDRGIEYIILETTSHALDQHRVFGIPYEIGVLTNVTHEHLDYHQTYENYLKTKLKLLKRAKKAIVNREDESYFEITKLRNNEIAKKKIISYGIVRGDITSHNFRFTTPLAGEYNQSNCLAAIAVTKALGIKDEIIKKAILGFKGIVGRFEFISTDRDLKIIVDFAHTPNALENVLKTLRPIVEGKLIHVFGCAGLRDKSKRPIMGGISAKYADLIILTEEDCRTEDVNEIIKEIETGINKKIKNKKLKIKNTCLPAGTAYKKLKILKIPDRQKAINKAIKLAGRGDLVLLTGKGHERSLCRGKKECLWSEHEAVKQALHLKSFKS